MLSPTEIAAIEADLLHGISGNVAGWARDTVTKLMEDRKGLVAERSADKDTIVCCTNEFGGMNHELQRLRKENAQLRIDKDQAEAIERNASASLMQGGNRILELEATVRGQAEAIKELTAKLDSRAGGDQSDSGDPPLSLRSRLAMEILPSLIAKAAIAKAGVLTADGVLSEAYRFADGILAAEKAG
jgi:hypothetical protein